MITQRILVETLSQKMRTRSRNSIIDKAPKKASKQKKNQYQQKKKSPTIAFEDNNASVGGSSKVDNSNKPWFTRFTKGDKEYDNYMSSEWGFEKRGDVPLFEKISLEGAQSGLSWLTILRKRDAYRRVFHHFEIDQVAAMTQNDVENILNEDDVDTRKVIVRHRGKIESVINNARCIQKLRLQAESSGESTPHGVFDNFLWRIVENKPILNVSWAGELKDANSQTVESQAMSKALKKLGFRFVGPTTCYAMMQSVGMVIDHPTDSKEWLAALERLKLRQGGYQER